MFSAYLLVFGCRGNNVVHQNGDQLCYSMHSRGECPVWCREAWGLSLGLGLVQPFPRYRVYDVEYSQFVCAGCLFKVGEELLDEDGLVLPEEGTRVSSESAYKLAFRASMLVVLVLAVLLTWTLATHRAVMLVIREPDTPGGFSESMAWRPASSSATTEEAMMRDGRSSSSDVIRRAQRCRQRGLVLCHAPAQRGADLMVRVVNRRVVYLFLLVFFLPREPSSTKLRDFGVREYGDEKGLGRRWCYSQSPEAGAGAGAEMQRAKGCKKKKVETSAANQWEPAGSDSGKPCFVSSLQRRTNSLLRKQQNRHWGYWGLELMRIRLDRAS